MEKGPRGHARPAATAHNRPPETPPDVTHALDWLGFFTEARADGAAPATPRRGATDVSPGPPPAKQPGGGTEMARTHEHRALAFIGEETPRAAGTAQPAAVPGRPGIRHQAKGRRA